MFFFFLSTISISYKLMVCLVGLHSAINSLKKKKRKKETSRLDTAAHIIPALWEAERGKQIT